MATQTENYQTVNQTQITLSSAELNDLINSVNRSIDDIKTVAPIPRSYLMRWMELGEKLELAGNFFSTL